MPALLVRYLDGLRFTIEFLQYEKSFLFFTVIGHQALAVEVILDIWKRPARAAKILENPWRGSAKEGNAAQHGDLVDVEAFLVLLGPARLCVAMIAEKGVGTEFAHDQGLVV